MKITPLVVTVVLLATALVHLLPVAGVLGAQRLSALYGVTIADPSLLLLMRHRALLFGVLALLMLAALVSAPLQPWALGAGLVSTASFVVLAARDDPLAAPLRTVMWIDVVLSVALLIALVLRLFSPR